MHGARLSGVAVHRRLSPWSANCGASFEWAGRTINPYLGFITGWLRTAGYVIGTVAGVVVLGPSVLAVFSSSSAYAWASTGIDTALCLIMLAIALTLTLAGRVTQAHAERLEVLSLYWHFVDGVWVVVFLVVYVLGR